MSADLAPSTPIRTARLLLRPADAERDVDAVHAYRSREDVCRWIPPEPASRERVAEILRDPERTRSVLTEPGQTLFLLVELDGRVIGDLVLFWRSSENAEVGYIVSPEVAGRGIATEVVRALLPLAFDGLGVHRVTGRIDQDNPASGRVLEKAGMRREAVLVENEWFKGRWSTEVDYAILDREWRALADQQKSPDTP